MPRAHTLVLVGDAAYERGGTRVAGLSSITGVYVWNLLLASLADQAADAGVELPIFASANAPGMDEFNAALQARYRPRVRTL